MTGAQIVRFFEALKTLRLPLEHHIRQCYQYSFPVRGVQFGTDADISPEEIQQQSAIMQASLFDSTATDATGILASTLVSNMTPANSRWGDITTEEEESGEVKDWLDSMATRTHKAIHASNYDAPGYEALLDVAIAGLCALYIEEGDDTDYVFEAWPLASCWFSCTKKGGSIDTVFLHFTLTAQQALREYGSRCPEKIADKAKTHPYERYPFVHAIMPKQFEPGAAKKLKDELLPFSSHHVCLTTKRIVRSKGYAEFPVAAPRWLKLPNSVYAQGPMSIALPDTKTLNEYERLILANADMQISGMWGAADDGVINIKRVKVGPRKVNFMKSKDSMWDMTPKGNIALGAELAQQKRSAIRRILMADQMQPLDEGPARTAAEWHYRVNMIRQMIGPMFGRLQKEFLQTIFFRCFGILLRKDLKAGKTLPRGLQNKPLRLRYVSPLARAQQMEDVAAMDRYEQGILQKSELLPDLVDIYDWDAAERKRGEALGVPQSLILDEEKVKELRRLKEDRKAKEAQATAAQETAKKQPAAPGTASAMGPAMMGGAGV